MSQRPPNDPLSFKDAEAYRRVREVFAATNFTDAGVSEALGISEARHASSRDVPLLLHLTRRGSPLDTLIRLFLMGVVADLQSGRRAVAPMTLEEWVEAGLLEVKGDAVTTQMRLLPYRGLVLAFDQTRRLQSDQAADYVMGIGSSSLTLASLTVRRKSVLTLDLGTGCGFQAFQAAPHSDRVLATDRNPRAVAIARFNARLNNLAHVECFEGDLFQPVAGCAFDLVVSNPPFVISPETRYIYRDSGLRADEVTRTIVGCVSGFLREGGYCQILCNWAHLAGEDWRQRLARWFEGTGCDAWVMPSDTLEAAAYAAKWIRHTEHEESDRYAERFQRWNKYYAREQIEAISGGLVTMRRRSGPRHWFRSDEAPEKILGTAGDSIVRIFENQDFLESLPGAEKLLECRLRIPPEVQLHQVFEPADKGWQPIDSKLKIQRGLAYVGDADPYIANLIVRCDGQQRLRNLVDDLGTALGKQAAEITPACLDIVRRLLARGFLLVEPDGPGLPLPLGEGRGEGNH